MITAKTYKSKLPIQANSCLRVRRLFLWVKGTWKMNVKKRIEKESFAIPLMMKGCPRWKVNMWYKRMERDRKLHEKDYIPGVLAYWHERGYLSSSIKRWGLTGKTKTDRISDFEYLYISPFNNTFSKWLDDAEVDGAEVLSVGMHHALRRQHVLQPLAEGVVERTDIEVFEIADAVGLRFAGQPPALDA